jgi:hypothetical protein
MAKKAQGLSMTTIIVAVLALLVLIIVGFILANKMGVFGKGVESCQSKHGECRESCRANEIKIGDHSNTDCQYSCCLPIYSEVKH